VAGAFGDHGLCGVAPFLVHTWRWRCRLGYLSVADFPVRRAVLCGDSLLAPDERSIQESLLEAVATDPSYSVVFFESIKVGSTLWSLLQTSPSLRNRFWTSMSAPTPHRRIHLPSTFQDYLGKFSARTRKKLRAYVRKLDEASGGRLELRCTRSAAEVRTFLEEAEKVSKVSWQGTRLGQVIRVEAQLPRLLSYAERGWLRAYTLSRDEVPIAFAIGTQADGIYYYEHPAYDPQWGSYNPGTVLLYRIIEHLYTDDRPDEFDFGSGDSEYKRLFSNHGEPCVNALLIRRTVPMAFPFALYRACEVGTRLTRRALDRFELRERVRHLLRRGPSAAPVAVAA